jgi:hypothetical protein
MKPSFRCVDEENNVGNWKTFRITEFDSLKRYKISSVRSSIQEMGEQVILDVTA